MDHLNILDAISRGRTDLIFELMQFKNWRSLLEKGKVNPLQWFVYYNDLTAIVAVLKNGGDLSSIDLNVELGNAAFFGHWKICDFLIQQGADVNSCIPATGETPLHGALCKAGRPHYIYTIRILVENGANVNATTIPDVETGAFMRDVRTKGETPLHRAAAYADQAIIQYLLAHGANVESKDANGNTPLTWASEHLRPAKIISLLTFGDHQLSNWAVERFTSDHGAGWGNGMEWNLLGDYLPARNIDRPDNNS